jgi:hypothetical protein
MTDLPRELREALDEAITDHRREMINTGQPQKDLAEDQGRKWTTAEMQAEFDVMGFAAPFVVVVRKSDGQEGTLEFTHSPRVYFGFSPHNEG